MLYYDLMYALYHMSYKDSPTWSSITLLLTTYKVAYSIWGNFITLLLIAKSSTVNAWIKKLKSKGQYAKR